MKNPTTTLLHTILSLTFFSLTSTHPTTPLYLPTLLTPTRTTNETNPHPTLECFTPSSSAAYPLTPTDCDNALDSLLHDRSGIMTEHTYSWHAHTPHSFGVPAKWAVGECDILLTTGIMEAVDEFPLVDVAVAARKVMDECVAISKVGLGGLALVGNGKGYFVAVNGPEPQAVGRGGRVVERG